MEKREAPAQWSMTLGDAYCKRLRSKPVDAITTEDVLAVLKPIWLTKAETASRLRGRIERVLGFARVQNWRSGDNPAAWRGHLAELLPKAKKLTRGRHAAMDYADVPLFVQRLRAVENSLAAKAVEFLILTAGRSGEVVGARWDEIDLERALWTVPGSRMKAGREHIVPLCEAALAVLRPLHALRLNDYVFPGAKHDRPLSASACEMLLRRMGVKTPGKGGATLHGFRSALRDFLGNETAFPRELAEEALGHQIGSAVERAYRRQQAVERRREMMEVWSRHLDGVSNVRELRRA